MMPHLEFGDPANLISLERVEDDDVVDPVDELGPEMLADDLHHRRLHLVVALLAGHLLDHVRAEIRGHDDDRVAKVHRAALAIGQPAVVEHLEQDVEHLG